MTPITAIDLTGFTEREPGVWTDAHGLLLSLHFFGLVPDLPASLDAPDLLRPGLARSAARAGGALIEAEVATVDTLPAVRQLIKVPLGGRPGQAFLASWTIPRDRCSTVVKVQAAEGATTGLREALVAHEVGPDRYFTPHPYGADITGGLPSHVADQERWDARFPDHPLTRVREVLRRITPSLALHEGFKTLPAFTPPGTAFAPAPAPAPGPAPATEGARRGWFGRRRG
ncbi:hypothetical protein ABZ135_06630 [Streptomyces sp. NPDC006339]|uniref:hypothetical protein n=1 Tax=Streptomyces sp. NPDC006339 TaxID=3156755 RepID=UPI0033A42FE0